MEGDNPGPWAFFLGGKWTRRRPRVPGLYPIAALDGTLIDPRKWRMITDEGGEPGLPWGEPGWLGWWWDRPVPPIIPPPMESV